MKGFFRFVAVLTVCAAVLSFFASCDGSHTQKTESAFDSTSSKKNIVGYPTYNPSGDTIWTPIYLATSAMKKESYFGGSGNSTKSSVTILKKAPDTLLVSTLDAGILSSTDAAALWRNSSVGIDSLGANAIAADPNNADFVVAVSTCSENDKANGIYISENAGQTWTKLENGPELIPNSDIKLIFDGSSYNASTKKSSVIYLCMTVDSDVGESILLRSDDSGKSFKAVRSINQNTSIAIHPTKSYVYLADSSGFYRSINRGFSFEPMLSEGFDSVFVSPAKPDCVFLISSDGSIVTSNDSGQVFDEERLALPNDEIKEVCVSPLNADYMLAYSVDKNSSVEIFYSANGGIGWHSSAVYDNPYKMSEASAEVLFAWSLSSPSVAYAIINNAIYKSIDGGALFTWSGNGDDSFDMNGLVSQNIHNPSYIAFAIDDATIATTNDGGSQWTINTYEDYKNRLSIKSVYPITRTKLVAIVENLESGEYSIRTSDNNGEYFNPTGVKCAANPYFYSDSTDNDIIFASNLRSSDGGKTWQEMSDCDYVLTHNPVSPNELFGIKGNSIVISYSKGAKWERLVNIGRPILDLSYDYIGAALYAATGDGLVKYYIQENRLEDCISSAFSNQFGENLISHVESDPLYPNVVYAGGMSSEYVNNSSVLISENSGKSWYVVSATASDSTVFSTCQGGLQPVDMLLSANRELIVFSAKFGIHKLSEYMPS